MARLPDSVADNRLAKTGHAALNGERVILKMAGKEHPARFPLRGGDKSASVAVGNALKGYQRLVTYLTRQAGRRRAACIWDGHDAWLNLMLRASLALDARHHAEAKEVLLACQREVEAMRDGPRLGSAHWAVRGDWGLAYERAASALATAGVDRSLRPGWQRDPGLAPDLIRQPTQRLRRLPAPLR